jgi:hypothetical protein
MSSPVRSPRPLKIELNLHTLYSVAFGLEFCEHYRHLDSQSLLGRWLADERWEADTSLTASESFVARAVAERSDEDVACRRVGIS